jgi:hypothetical protein
MSNATTNDRGRYLVHVPLDHGSTRIIQRKNIGNRDNGDRVRPDANDIRLA